MTQHGFHRCFFVAYRGDRPIGRISAQINNAFQQHHRNKVGHFGFFDCVNDLEAARALVEAAAAWLRSHGARRMEGPFSLSINEECGLLVEGFETPPAVLMTHSRPYMGALLEKSGLTKIMDSFAYRITGQAYPDKIKRLANLARSSNNLTIRQVDTSKFDEEIRTVVGIFNEAWSENWGFVPFSEAEIVALTKEMKPFYRNHYGRIVLLNNEPIAMILAIPDINDLIRGMGGRLLPVNWLRLAVGLWRETFTSARIPLMGIKRNHRARALAAPILALMVAEFFAEAKNYGLDWAEFSWVLENNSAMNTLGEMAAGKPVKRYRFYGKEL